ncbi:Amidase [Geodia barretti]|uniref:Amidase n=1 Tax=Geodia barretti TaxID=519541 RepID=A0AA35W5M6_GEOBA|nr:Amidase [Geodia barretti]
MTHEITFASIDELSSLIRGGELSPVEVTDAAFERIQETEPKLNAFLELFEEGARSAAREAEAEITAGRYRGPLHGVPVGLKDLVDVAGSPTTGGSPLFQQNVARTDATITSRFRQAGAIIIGKTNLVMHAMGATGLNPYTGHPHNPWDLERCTGGSSSGSGAAIAAGCLVGAIGTDTGGSIRMPASMCGITGLKPTYGRVSRAGVLDLSWSCDHVGPMARRVSDCAYMMNALAGYDPRDPASADEPVVDYTLGLDRGPEDLRIGVPSDYFFAENVDPEIDSAVRAAST